MTLRLASIAIPVAFFAVAQAQAPRPFGSDASELGHFAFEEHELTAIGSAPGSVREVHPELAHIAGWISSVGAAVALFDLDGDGLNNDYCLVDPRFDSVTVGPVPTTGDRYAPFEVQWSDGDATPGSVAPMGCLPADLDRDGSLDLVVYYWGRPPTLHFAAKDFAAVPLLAASEPWHTNAAIVADMDGDGLHDLVFGNYFPGDVEILGTAGAPRMQHSMSRARNAGRNRLFLARGRGRFEDASAALNAVEPTGWTLALGAADLDGDLLPELYVANDFGPDHLLHNRSTAGKVRFAKAEGRRGLTDTRSRVLGRDSFKGMGVDFGDIDRDGVLDMYVSNIAEDYALMESHLLFRGTGNSSDLMIGRAPFEEVSGQFGVARSSWSWDARFVDFDGDGWDEILQATGFLRGETDRWPELHEIAMGNDELLRFPWVWARFDEGADLSGDRRDALFVRGSDGRWHDGGAAIGLADGTVTRGIALGDVDGDGDMDALLARQWMPSVLMLNVSDPVAPTAVLDLRIAGPDGTEQPVLGARVTFGSQTGAGPRPIRVVSGGAGHSGKSAPEVHVGLGAFEPGSSVVADIAWRDATGLHRVTVPVTAGRQVIRLVPNGERQAAWIARGR